MSEGTNAILQPIMAGKSRDAVVAPYRRGLRRDDVDWPLVNSAIIARWSVSALRYIKREAWR